MSARALNWAWQQQPKTTSQKLVLAALADRADEDGFAFPSNNWLATKCAPMPVETVRRVVRELAGQGLVVKEERKRRNDGTLGVWILRLPLDQRASLNGGTSVHGCPDDHRSPVTEPPFTHARTELSTEVLSTEPKYEKNPDGFSLVIKQWLDHAPPLRRHGDAYFEDAALRRLVNQRTKRYGLDEVLAAIVSYAEVLASPEHFLSKQWSMELFFKQANALPNFVPDANPLSNYRTYEPTSRRKRGLTFEEILYGGSTESGTESLAGLPRAA